MIPTGKAHLLANLTTAGFFATLGQFCLTPAGLSFLSTLATAALATWARSAAAKERDAVRAAELERAKLEDYRQDRMVQRIRSMIEASVDVAVRQAMTSREQAQERDRAKFMEIAKQKLQRRVDEDIARAYANPIAVPLAPLVQCCRKPEPRPDKPDLKLLVLGDDQSDGLSPEVFDAIDSADPRYWVNLPSPDEPHPNHDDHAAQSDRARG